MLFSFFIVLLVADVYSDMVEEKGEVACQYSENELGQCVTIYNCKKIYSLLETKSREDLNRLRELHCGFQGIHPQVCCPPEEVLVDEVNITTSSRQPEELHGHACDLLPNTTECGFFLEERVYEFATLDGYPWMALLEYKTSNGSQIQCGGALINNRYVLTAAHCVAKEDLKGNRELIGVRLGEYDTRTNPDCDDALHTAYNCCCTNPIVTIGIEEVIVHSGYKSNDINGYDNIALIRLNHDVTFTGFIRPICLQPLSLYGDKANPGKSSIVGGWGYSENSQNSAKKVFTKLEIVTNEECSKKVGLRLRSEQICAYPRKGGNSCRGDSGGILMNDKHITLNVLNYIALGVTSRTYSDCSKDDDPIVFTKVESYIPWIIKNLKH